MESDKKGKKLIITIIVMALIIFGLGGYITYDKVFAPKSKPKTKQSRKIKKSSVEKIKDEEVEQVMKQINAYNTFLSNDYPITEISKIDNQKILKFAYMTIENANTTFTEKQVDKVIKEYFGNEFKYKNEDINCFLNDGVLYKYDENTGIYTFYGIHGHGGSSIERGKSYYIDGEYDKDKNEYKVKVKILYGPPAGDTYGPIDTFYKEPNSKDKIYEIDINTLENFNDEKYDDVYKEVKDKLPITTFIFKKDSEGNTGLIKVEKENK